MQSFCGWIRTCIKDCRQRISRHGGAGTGFGKVIRGSKEGFTDSIKTNTALIRKRVRSTRVKVEEVQEGVRSHTAIDLVYMADLKYESVLRQIREKLQNMRLTGSWTAES